MSKDPEDKSGAEDEEILHTFDMYHFFSRKDVILIILLVLGLLIYVLSQTLFAPQAA